MNGNNYWHSPARLVAGLVSGASRTLHALGGLDLDCNKGIWRQDCLQ